MYHLRKTLSVAKTATILNADVRHNMTHDELERMYCKEDPAFPY